MIDVMVIEPADFIISDTHWGHDNIIKYAERPANHDQLMLGNWRRTVGPRDRIFHLGDVCFPERAKHLLPFIADLPAYIKLLLKGNHDKKTETWFRSVLNMHCVARLAPIVTQTHIYVFSHVPMDELLMAAHVTSTPEGGFVYVGVNPDTLDVNDLQIVNIHGHVHYKDNKYLTAFDTATHRNVNVEFIGYTPRRLSEIMDEATYKSICAEALQAVTPT